jgi:hypothetical protein
LLFSTLLIRKKTVIGVLFFLLKLWLEF